MKQRVNLEIERGEKTPPLMSEKGLERLGGEKTKKPQESINYI